MNIGLWLDFIQDTAFSIELGSAIDFGGSKYRGRKVTSLFTRPVIKSAGMST